MYIRMITIKFLILLSIGYLQTWHVWSLPQQNISVCNSTECVELASTYLKNLKVNGDPCDNFYEYTCHGWANSNKRPENVEWWSVDRVLALKTLTKLRDILSVPDPSDSKDVEVLKGFYDTCSKIPYLSKSTPEEITEIITRIGNWPIFFTEREVLPNRFNWWIIDKYYLKVAGESAIFDFTFKPGFYDSNPIVIELEKPESIFGTIHNLVSWNQDQQESYKKFLMSIVETVGKRHSLRKQKLESDVKEVIQFRNRFERLMTTIRNENYTYMSINRFQQWYTNLIKSSAHGYVNWLEEIRALRQTNNPNVTVYETDIVRVPLQYFSKFAMLILQTPIHIIVNHIHLYFVERHLVLRPETKTLLTNSISIFGSRRFLENRWKWCIDKINEKDTLSRLYVKHHFSRESKTAVQNMLQTAKELLEAQIANSTWLSNDAKKATISKLSNLKSMVGYPDWYDDPNAKQMREIFPAIPIEADAYVTEPDGRYIKNHVSITAGYLQPPIYTINAPDAVNYGSLMSILLHELHHLFKQKEPPYSTNSSISWWPRSDCFRNHFKKFKDNYVKHLNTSYKFESVDLQTLNEDVADAMGLKIAYEGFKQKMEKENNTCTLLPGFEEFSCEQLFFIAFGNTQCTSATREARLQNYQITSHNGSPVRINGPVASMKAFSNAFNCKKGDRMWTKDTCSIW